MAADRDAPFDVLGDVEYVVQHSTHVRVRQDRAADAARKVRFGATRRCRSAALTSSGARRLWAGPRAAGRCGDEGERLQPCDVEAAGHAPQGGHRSDGRMVGRRQTPNN
mgnify:CR=1 FL=1